MTPFTIGLIGTGIMFLVMILGMPVGLAMGFIGFLGYCYIVGLDAGLANLGQVPFDTVYTYSLSVVPLFVLMGSFAFHSGLSRELYDLGHKWVGHWPGGLSMATIVACAGFAAISGSSTAAAATMGTVALPEMKRYKYDPGLATGTVAAGGTLGILIPPSIILVIYGIIAEQNIAKLLIAGFLPGFLLAALFMLAIYIVVKRNPGLAVPGARSSFKERMVGLKSTIWVLALFVLVMGGLYLGVFTPTEAGGVGAFGAFVIALARRQLTWRTFMDSLVTTGRTVGMIFIIVIGAMLFGYFLAVSRVPTELADFVMGLGLSPYLVLLCVFVVYLFLGCIMDGLAMILLTVPIFFPLIIGAGFDPIWFGIIMVLVVEMAMITPPVGINVYVISGLAKDVPMWTIFRGIVPFLVAMIICFILVTAFPQIALFLPSLM